MTRNLARLAVTPNFLVAALKGADVRQFKVRNPLPDDTELAGVIVAADSHNLVWLTLESKEFAPVEDGMIIPELDPVVCETVRSANA